MRDIRGVQVSNRDMRCGRMQKQLVRRKDDITLGREDDALCTLLESRFKLLPLVTNPPVYNIAMIIHTRGMISVGSVVSLWANSSLYEIK